jgi:hypothetical protein
MSLRLPESANWGVNIGARCRHIPERHCSRRPSSRFGGLKQQVGQRCLLGRRPATFQSSLTLIWIKVGRRAHCAPRVVFRMGSVVSRPPGGTRATTSFRTIPVVIGSSVLSSVISFRVMFGPRLKPGFL